MDHQIVETLSKKLLCTAEDLLINRGLSAFELHSIITTSVSYLLCVSLCSYHKDIESRRQQLEDIHKAMQNHINKT